MLILVHNNMLCLILALMVSTFFSNSCQTVCTQADFPKIFGGQVSITYFNQIDYHDESELLCACGNTKDNNLAPGIDTTYNVPIVVCYQGAPNFPYKWGKFFQQTAVSIIFTSIAFNPTGTRAITHSSNNLPAAIVTVWNTNDGTLINARTFPESDGYSKLVRNIIIDSSGFCIISKQVVGGAATNIRLFKFQSETFQTTIVWGRQTIAASMTAMGLVFGYSNDEIISFTSLSNTAYLTSLNSTEGTLNWHYQLSAANGGSYCLQYSAFSPTSQMIVGVISSSGSYLQYARLVLANGVITERDNFYDSTFNNIIVALRLIDTNTAKAVLTGSFSIWPYNYQTLLATINFSTLQIQFLQTIPKTASNNAYNLGRFVSDTKFYIGAISNRLNMDTASTPTQQLFLQYSGLIFSSEMDYTCQTFYSNAAQINSLTKVLNAITDTTQTTDSVYTDIQTTYTATQYITNSLDLVLTTLFSSSFCLRVNSGSYNLYAITSAQSTNSFSASAGTATTFSITAFSTSSQSCGTTSPTFTYSAVNDDMYETPLPSFMAVNPSTGAISITSSSIVGVYPIQIIGTLQNGQRKREVFHITVKAPNFPPGFSTALIEQTVVLNSVKTYQLPTIIDPESDPVTVTTYKTGDLTLPGFIKFSATTTFVYTISPTAFSEVGTTSITVKLNDGTNSPTFTFDITVTNTAPTFSSSPLSQTVALNSVKAVTLPAIIDAEGNPATISYSPTLAFVSITPTTLTLNPNLFSEVKTHSITITLSDGQPLSTNYPINIVVTNSAPTFSIPPEDQAVACQASLDYSLPTFSDAEGNAINLSLSPSLQFIKLVGSTVKISPTQYSQEGTHTMTLTLSDGQPLTSSYSFNIIVTNCPPSFSSSLVDQTVPIFSTKIYSLPSYSNPQQSLSISLNPTLSYITLIGLSININPTSYSQVGIQAMTVILSDGVLQSNVQFNIQITNAAPTFSTAPVDQQIAYNSLKTYTLPTYSDPEGDTSISLSITAYPSFVSVSGIVLTMSPNLYSDVGSHTVTITLSDGEPKTQTYSMIIQVTNQAPTFVTAPVDQTIHVNAPQTYNLPTYLDPEGDSVFISITPTLTFITLTGSTLFINPTLFSQLGIVSITIELRDNEPKSTQYIINFKIVNSAPTFTSQTPIDQTVPLNHITTYTLPLYSDPEGHLIKSTLAPSLAFVKLENDVITINPTLFSEVSDYSMTLTLSDGEPKLNVYYFKISVTNSPPIFASALVDQIAPLNSITVHTLPSISDPESNPFTLTTYKQGASTLPTFITFDPSTNTYSFQPSTFTDVGTTQIVVKLDDSQAYKLFSFNVIVTNTAPTFTIPIPASLSLQINADNIYNFSDAEGNAITVTSNDENNSGSPSYIIMNNPTSINIKATQFSEILNTHHVQISLSDGQLSSPIYSFDVTFTNSAPIFITAPVDQTVTLNSLQTYQLPSYSDLEGNAVVVALQSPPNFVTLSGTNIIMNPTASNMIGSHALIITLSDGEPKTSTYTINLEVVNLPTPPPSPPQPTTPPPGTPPSTPTPPATPPPSSAFPTIPPPSTPPPSSPPPAIPPNSPTPTTPPASPPPQPPIQSNLTTVPQVLNSPPTLSIGPLDPLIIKAGDSLNYTLPAIIDINNGTISLSLELADCIPFAAFNATNRTISFKPSESNARTKPYQITIKLFDNVSKSGTTYYLKVYIQSALTTQVSNTSFNNTQQQSNTTTAVGLQIIDITSAGQIVIQFTSPNKTISDLIIQSILDQQLQAKVTSQENAIIQLQILDRLAKQSMLLCKLLFNNSYLQSQRIVSALGQFKYNYIQEPDQLELSFAQNVIILNNTNLQIGI